jgi:hypothetical protein
MGYTHYWGVDTKKIHGKTEKFEKLYQKAIRDCNKVIKAYYKENKGTDNSLSGYSAHCKNGAYGGINLNGKGDNMHETFLFREHLKQNRDFEFCKTARKPYDLVVVSCLSIMKFHLGAAIEVSSDGDFDDWIDGIDYANKVLRRTKNKIESPIKFDVDRDLKLA